MQGSNLLTHTRIYGNNNNNNNRISIAPYGRNFRSAGKQVITQNRVILRIVWEY